MTQFSDLFENLLIQFLMKIHAIGMNFISVERTCVYYLSSIIMEEKSVPGKKSNRAYGKQQRLTGSIHRLINKYACSGGGPRFMIDSR